MPQHLLPSWVCPWSEGTASYRVTLSTRGWQLAMTLWWETTLNLGHLWKIMPTPKHAIRLTKASVTNALLVSFSFCHFLLFSFFLVVYCPKLLPRMLLYANMHLRACFQATKSKTSVEFWMACDSSSLTYPLTFHYKIDFLFCNSNL